MRLRSRVDFQRIRGDLNFVGQWIRISWRQAAGKYPKLGITVTRRFGKAHQRNRFKRLVREAFRLTVASFPAGLEIVVKPRSVAPQATMPAIKNDLIVFVENLC